MGVARRMWQLYEPVHIVTYFTPEARAAADRLGMRGFWMGYVAQRVAPIGQVDAPVATAAFFGFHPARIARALPDAWALTSPQAALAARLDGAGAALRRLWGERAESAEVAEAAELAWRAAAAADTAGRVLAAANQALPRPEPVHLALWQACTTLREHRGDGHVAALVAHRISPVRSHLLKVAAGESEGEWLRDGRRFTPEAWQQGYAELRGAGLVDADGGLTAAGQRLHEEVEAATDDAAEQPWQVLGEPGTSRLAELLTPLADAVLGSGVLPVPNPIGLVRDPAPR